MIVSVQTILYFFYDPSLETNFIQSMHFSLLLLAIKDYIHETDLNLSALLLNNAWYKFKCAVIIIITKACVINYKAFEQWTIIILQCNRN